MNDITTRHSQQHLGVLGDNELSRRHNRSRNSVLLNIGARSWIVVFPPPLLTSDVDRHFSVAGFRQFKNCACGRNSNTQKNQYWNDGQNNFDSRLTVSLLRNGLAAIAIAIHHPGDSNENNDTNDAGDVEHGSLQIVNLLSIRSGWLPGILRCILGATSQETQCRNGNRCL